jgi:hypothetical protein
MPQQQIRKPTSSPASNRRSGDDGEDDRPFSQKPGADLRPPKSPLEAHRMGEGNDGGR